VGADPDRPAQHIAGRSPARPAAGFIERHTNPSWLTTLFTIGRHNGAMSNRIQSSTMAIANTFAFNGIEAVPVEVQVQIAPGTPGLVLVGLPDKAVGEARERGRA